MSLEAVLERQDRIVMERGLREVVRQNLSQNNYSRIVCPEERIVCYLRETPQAYERLLQLVVAHVVLELASQLKKQEKEACVHASIRHRRNVVLSISFKEAA